MQLPLRAVSAAPVTIRRGERVWCDGGAPGPHGLAQLVAREDDEPQLGRALGHLQQPVHSTPAKTTGPALACATIAGRNAHSTTHDRAVGDLAMAAGGGGCWRPLHRRCDGRA